MSELVLLLLVVVLLLFTFVVIVVLVVLADVAAMNAVCFHLHEVPLL